MLKNSLSLWTSGGSVEWLVLDRCEIISPNWTQSFALSREQDLCPCNMEVKSKKSHWTEQKPKPPNPVTMSSPVYLGPVHKNIFLAPCCLHTCSASVHICQPAESYLWYNHLLTHPGVFSGRMRTYTLNIKHFGRRSHSLTALYRTFIFFIWFLVQNVMFVVQLEESCVKRWTFGLCV